VVYGEDAKDSRLHVSMDIVKMEARRVREDSVVTIANKGLLGDKMVVIKVGSPDKSELPNGSTLRTEPGLDLSAMTDAHLRHHGQGGDRHEQPGEDHEHVADPDVREDSARPSNP